MAERLHLELGALVRLQRLGALLLLIAALILLLLLGLDLHQVGERIVLRRVLATTTGEIDRGRDAIDRVVVRDENIRPVGGDAQRPVAGGGPVAAGVIPDALCRGDVGGKNTDGENRQHLNGLKQFFHDGFSAGLVGVDKVRL